MIALNNRITQHARKTRPFATVLPLYCVRNGGTGAFFSTTMGAFFTPLRCVAETVASELNTNEAESLWFASPVLSELPC